MKINPKTNLPDYSQLDIWEIAGLIRKDWKNMYFGAVPYVDAMACVKSVNDTYGVEDGKTQVMYFLANGNTWRGEVARAIKKELNKRIK